MRSKRGTSRSHWKYPGTPRTQFRVNNAFPSLIWAAAVVHRHNSWHMQDSQLLLAVQFWIIALSDASVEQCTHKTTRGAWMRQLTVPAPQPSSNNQHSTAEAPEILQGAGTTPLCLSANTALPQVRILLLWNRTSTGNQGKKKFKKPTESFRSAWIYSFRTLNTNNE